MEKIIKDFGLSPEQIERIKSVQNRKSIIDPGCEKLTPEEFINWHPVGGMSWEERSRRMKTAGETELKKGHSIGVSDTQLATASN